MNIQYKAAMVLLMGIVAPSFSMERPPGREDHMIEQIRFFTASSMIFAGIRYLQTVYGQQMHPPTPMPRGFRNAAFRYLTMFFTSAGVQQAAVNIAGNPQRFRLQEAIRTQFPTHCVHNEECDASFKVRKESDE